MREALHLLEREGLVRLVPRRGALVQGFTAADVRELYELRELLEPAAAALATVRADAAERQAVQRLARLTDRPRGGFAPNRDFHHALCAPCGNGLDHAHARLGLDAPRGRAACSRTRRCRPARSSAWPPSTPAIAQAFAEADAARVRALVHDHVRAAGSDALERLPGHQDNEAEEIS